MSAPLVLDSPADRDAAAADYVLGLLDEAGLQAVALAAARDPALAAAIAAWQDRLLPLTAQVPGRAPSPGLWARIDASVHILAEEEKLRAVLATAAAAAAARPATRASAPRPPWWQRLGLWQGLSGLALAAAVLMGTLLLQPGLLDGGSGREAAGQRYLAVLNPPGGGAAGWVVEVQAGGQLRLLPVSGEAAAPVPDGRSLQFWTKPEGAAGPTSLGLVRAGEALRLPVSRLPAVGGRQLFEITLEPEGGSTLGRPTGPILYVGRTVAI